MLYVCGNDRGSLGALTSFLWGAGRLTLSWDVQQGLLVQSQVCDEPGQLASSHKALQQLLYSGNVWVSKAGSMVAAQGTSKPCQQGLMHFLRSAGRATTRQPSQKWMQDTIGPPRPRAEALEWS